MALGSRRAADALAAALERPDAPMSADIQRFTRVVRALQTAERPVISAAFSADVRTRLLREFPDVITVGSGPASERVGRDSTVRIGTVRGGGLGPRRRRLRRPALASIGAVAAVVIGTATALGAVSQQALPGDALYPVKRGIERVEVGTAQGDHSKGEHLLSQAGTRLAEIRALSITRGDGAETSQLVDDTLSTFRDQASQAATRLISDYAANHDGASIRDIRSFAATSVTELATIVNRLAPSTGGFIRQTVRTLRTIDDSASTTCPSCSTRPALRIPPPLQAALSPGGATRPGADSPANGPAAKAQRPGGRPHPGGSGKGSRSGAPNPPSPRHSNGPGAGIEPSGGGRSLPTSVPGLPTPTLSIPPQVPGAPAAGGGDGTPAIPLPSPPVQLP
jgi:hypothetical protein